MLKQKLNIFDIAFTEIFKLSYMCCEINILFFAFLEKLPSRCSMEPHIYAVKQPFYFLHFLKYCRNTFRSQENLGSSIEENGMREGFISNL